MGAVAVLGGIWEIVFCAPSRAQTGTGFMADLGSRIEGADLASLQRLVSQLAGPCQHDPGAALRTMNRQV